MNQTIKDFKEAVVQATKETTKGYDTSAQIVRVEGNTAWVHIPGGVDETPVKLTVNANEGDTVQVRVSGGSAWITGNATSPPTDDTRAIKADNTAINAQIIADNAMQSASTAANAAGRAVVSANRAEQAATDAQTSATEANQQATYATNYANNALTQLSTVESVVDTLTWISEHSVFVPTTDSTVQADKLYYVPANNVLPMTSGTTELNGVTYVVDAVAGTVTANGTATSLSLFGVGIPDATAGDKIWFSGVSGGGSHTYGLRYSNGPQSVEIYDGIGTATVKSSGNLYLNIYVASGVTVNNVVFTPRVATENEGFEYQIVENPTGNPSANGYYELSTDEAVKTYVQSHLALTSEGLWLLPATSGTNKVLIATGAGSTYTIAGTYLIDSTGGTVASFRADGATMSANNVQIAHLGYGAGTDSGGGTSDAPFYTFGVRTGNVGNYSVSEGLSTTASAYVSHAEGYETTASDQFSHAEGRGTTASGYVSHAEGGETTASGAVSHAEGGETTASDQFSHAEGYGTTASAPQSHAEGRETTANGDSSHSEGAGTVASGNYSHAQNNNTIAASDNQTALGKYNVEDNAGTYAVIVGNGANTNNRANIMTVDWNGGVDTKGDVNIASGKHYKINGTNLAASNVGAVPTSRTVNSKALSSNITLSASDVGALASSSVADYITSKGTSGNWYYEKWNSGKIEAIFKGSVTYGSMSASGQLYRSTNNAVAIPSGIFAATPQRTEITLNNAATVVVCATAVASSSTNVNVQIWRSTNSASSIDATIRCVYIP